MSHCVPSECVLLLLKFTEAENRAGVLLGSCSQQGRSWHRDERGQSVQLLERGHPRNVMILKIHANTS